MSAVLTLILVLCWCIFCRLFKLHLIINTLCHLFCRWLALVLCRCRRTFFNASRFLNGRAKVVQITRDDMFLVSVPQGNTESCKVFIRTPRHVVEQVLGSAVWILLLLKQHSSTRITILSLQCCITEIKHISCDFNITINDKFYINAKLKKNFIYYLRATAVPAGTAEARISYGNSVCLSIRLSVCPSVRHDPVVYQDQVT